MSLSDLASIGSFVSGLAVAVTLILLLVQLRQTNRNQKALMQQGRSARVVNAILAASEPHLSEAMSRAMAGDANLTASQARSFIAYATAHFWSFEDTFLQHRAGLLEHASWSIDVESLRAVLSLPAYRATWRIVRAQSSGAYRDFVDDLMRRTATTKPFDELAVWKSLMAEEQRAGARRDEI